jgi:heme exporter protein D
METYFSVLAFVMVILTVTIAIVGFSLMQQSMNKILRQMDQQRARQDQIWQQLFAKAENTERMSQEILTRLASRDSVH